MMRFLGLVRTPLVGVVVCALFLSIAPSRALVAQTDERGSEGDAGNRGSEDRRIGTRARVAGNQARQGNGRRRIPVRIVRPGESRVPSRERRATGSTDREPGDTVELGEGAIAEGASRSDRTLNVAEVDRGPVDATVAAGGDLLLAPALDSAAALELPLDGKRTIATRTSAAPVLDGRVDEPVWASADVVGDFLQKDPVAGAAPSQRTEVRVLYDEDNLYFGWILYDDEPDKIVATDLERDSFMFSDDTLAIYLDTFHDHRNAFAFVVNPLGTKLDLIVRDESQTNRNWDEAWEAAASITERGWEAEVVIPFTILRYPTGSHVWGIEFERCICRNNERANWSNTSRDYDWQAISQAGHLVGLEGLELTDRFRLKPFVTGGYDSLRQTDAPLSESSGNLGIEFFRVQLTPNLTANLTANTDFAQVEVDDERVNLTRFSLFFPEKREFFLEAANSFSFGTLRRRGGGGGGRGGFRGPPLALLFFSRRIGLGPAGELLPIRFGGKLTGKIGGGTLGFLNVQTGDSKFGSGQNYTALRWKQDVLSRSSVGALVTNVQGADGSFNRVLGTDGSFTFFDHLFVSAFAAVAQDDDVEGSPWAGQFSVGWDTDQWDIGGEITYIGADFDSDLGFVLRRDIIRQRYRARWSPRPSWSLVRQAALSGAVEYITDTTGRLVSRRTDTEATVELESGDWIWFSVDRNFERLDFGFPIDESVTIDAGDYSWTNVNFGFHATERRWFSGSVTVDVGEFYDGTRFGVGGGPRIRLSEKFSLGPSYSYNRIKLPGGAFSTHLVRIRTNLHFSDRLLVDSLAQHSSVTDQLSFFARLRYIYRTGDDFYLVYRQATAFSGLFDGLNDRSLTAKMTYAFQW